MTHSSARARERGAQETQTNHVRTIKEGESSGGRGELGSLPLSYEILVALCLSH